MSAPPFRARFLELIHEQLARWMPELLFQPTKARSRAAVPQKIRVAHLAEPGAHVVELEWLDAYGAHDVNQSARQAQDEDYDTDSNRGQHDSQPAWDVFPSIAESRLRVRFGFDDFVGHNSRSVSP
jgi:hypothetical protein